MLTSMFGIKLVLWMGSSVPLPAPQPLLEALTDVQVTLDDAHGDAFELTFAMGRQPGGLDYASLMTGAVDFLNLCLIGVVMGVMPLPLINGVITEHHLVPADEPGMANLTVRGRSVLLRMNLDEKNQKFQNMTDSMVVLEVLAPYMQYGIVPSTIAPTFVFKTELEGNTHQHEHDLQFLRRLARKNGFVFYLEPITIGLSGAYWGPENRLGIPQPALTKNMGGSSNLKSISFANDGLAPTGAKGSFVEPISKVSIPIPALPALRLPPLASSAVPVSRTELLRQSGNQAAPEAFLTALAASTQAPDPVTAHGEVDTIRYGSVLMPRQLVGIRGVGTSYDGFYYVNRVTHKITVHGGYTQEFSCKREGTGALLPLVRP
jgi:hypothetical protein